MAPIMLTTGLPRSLKILESPGIGKRKFQALEWAIIENQNRGSIFSLEANLVKLIAELIYSIKKTLKYRMF